MSVPFLGDSLPPNIDFKKDMLVKGRERKEEFQYRRSKGDVANYTIQMDI